MSDPLALLPLALAVRRGRVDGVGADQLVAAGLTLLRRSNAVTEGLNAKIQWIKFASGCLCRGRCTGGTAEGGAGGAGPCGGDTEDHVDVTGLRHRIVGDVSADDVKRRCEEWLSACKQPSEITVG